MKKFILFIFFSLLIEGYIYSQQNGIQINGGIPINKKLDWSKNNFYTNLNYKRIIKTNIISNIELSYVQADLKSSYAYNSILYLTYDRKIFSIIISGGYQIKITNKLTLSPKIGVGNAFIWYKSHEFHSNWNKTNGVSLCGDLQLAYNLFNNIEIDFGVNYNLILSKFTDDTNLIINHYYLIIEEKNIKQSSSMIGVTYKF